MNEALVKVAPYLVKALELLKKALDWLATDGDTYIDKAIEFLGKYIEK